MTGIATDERAIGDTVVRRAMAGDREAFTRLVATYDSSMAKVAYVVSGDPDLARDAVQAAWTIAWRRLGGLRDPGQVRAWLLTIAANEARQLVRRRRRHPVVDLSIVGDATDGHGDPGDRIHLLDLERALHRLKPDDRALIALRYIAGLDSGQIAAQLGGSASGIRSRLSRAIEHLRTDLDHA
ncbi:MAG TPA: sigma-70 family RNA polymerase sigma factor [Candidatus Limnocylindrales bacterium]|jgi:RNA polymerase sigma-70 factor (ECF subfamily)|nr:sigma-70 family RNA polymerase sigma factor [Candidatus Limnocylindrales bacterium]